MYGEPDAMRRRVDQLREQAVDVRSLADRLVAGIEGTGWTGRAAEAMRLRVTERAGHLRDVAGRHDSAADALERHLQQTEAQQEAIAAVERRAETLRAEARTRVAQVRRDADTAADTGVGAGTLGAVVRLEPDPDDEALLAFDPPPPGHRDWLSVELPGL